MNKNAMKEKAVLITVYVVNSPRRRRRSWSTNNHHRDHCRLTQIGSGRSYNRKAELLQYSQRLRASVQPEKPKLGIIPAATPTKNHVVGNKKIVPVCHKPQKKKSSTCFGDWKTILLPGFVQRSPFSSLYKKVKKGKKPDQSMANEMNTVAKTFRMKPEFVKKLVLIFQKRN